MIVDKINSFLSNNDLTLDEHIASQVGWLASYTFKRQFMEQRETKPQALWVSDSGKCGKQVAYRYHGIEKAGKEIDSRAKIIFWQGDLIEAMITTLAKLAGINIMATGLNQLHVSLPSKKEIPFAEPEEVYVTGRPDGVLLEGGKPHLVEVKSMSSYGFDRFEKNSIDEAYVSQCNMYMYTLGLQKCIIIALNKDNGIMSEKILDFNLDLFHADKDTFISVLNSTAKELPEAKYHANEKGFYPWNCRFCQWFKICKPNSELVLVGKSYKLKKKEEGK